MYLQGVQCPGCDSIKSWKKLYSNNIESAEWAVGRKHSTRCNECQTVFTYIPEIKRRWTGRRHVIAVSITIESTDDA